MRVRHHVPARRARRSGRRRSACGSGLTEASTHKTCFHCFRVYIHYKKKQKNAGRPWFWLLTQVRVRSMVRSERLEQVMAVIVVRH